MLVIGDSSGEIPLVEGTSLRAATESRKEN